MPNRPEYFVAAHATWKLGAVQVPLNVMFREDEGRFVLADSGARCVVAGPEQAPVVERVAASLPDPEAAVAPYALADEGDVPIAGCARRGIASRSSSPS